jgi:uncharacterized protein (TIRG00374 family)
MNSRSGRIAWMLAGLSLLGFMIFRSGPVWILSDLKLVGSGLILVIAIEFAVDAFNALGWWFTFPPDLRYGSLRKLFFVKLAGSAVNSAIPTASIGGESTKVYLLDGDFPIATVIATILTSGLIFSFSKAGFIAVSMLFTWRRFQLSHDFSLAVLIGFIVTLAGVLAFLLVQIRGFSGAMSRIVRRLPIPARWAAHITKLGPGVDAEMAALYRSRTRDLLLAICVHQLAFLCGVMQILLMLGWLGLPRSFANSLAIEGFAMLLGFVTFVIPGEVGIQEGGKVVIFTALGLPASAGLAVGIVFRLTSLAGAAAGLIALAALKGRKRPALALGEAQSAVN